MNITLILIRLKIYFFIKILNNKTFILKNRKNVRNKRNERNK